MTYTAFHLRFASRQLLPRIVLLLPRVYSRAVSIGGLLTVAVKWMAEWASCTAGLVLISAPALSGQTVASPGAAPSANPEEIVQLSPFTVESSPESGYMASSSLAGTRLRTELKDVGTSISVLTREFLDDIGATDNMSALTFATNMEVGGVTGNYQNAPNTGSWGQTDETGNLFNPNNNTRVRGLTSADNTRNYFRSTVAWDGYNVSRIDILRGSNSILFGLGSPGGVINATTDSANLGRDGGEVNVATDEFGSFRGTANLNKVVIKNELALRVALLNKQEKFQQKPAYDTEHRWYLATKYRPQFLNKNGVTLDLSLDYERGNGTSNRPRTAPPLDYLTGWVQPVSTRAIQLPPGTNFRGFPNGVIPAYTEFANHAGVTFNQNVGRTFGPEIQLWGDAFGPRLNVNSLASTQPYWRQGRVWVEGVLLANGTRYFGPPQAARNLFGYGNGFQDTPLAPLDAYLRARGHPLGSYFVPPQLTDPSAFDFYNKLLDGPNKEEWSDFNQFRTVLANTFFKQKVGYEVSYYRENAQRGQTTFLSNAARIFVDTQLEDIEGKPNPDFGRPYVQETTGAGNRIRKSEIEGFRASAFVEHDFKAAGERSAWWRRIVGRHIFNGAYAEDEVLEETRNFQRHVLGPEFVAKSPNNPLFNNRTRVSVRNYVGPSLAGRTTLSGANIGNLDRYVISPGGTISLRYFDTTWKAPASVNPATAWVNPLGQRWEEAANPANYVGWTNGNYTLIDGLSGKQEDLDAATRDASLARNKVNSKVVTWQGHLFDGLLVGTAGAREDQSSSRSYQTLPNPEPYNSANLSPAAYNLNSSNPNVVRDSLVVRATNYSAVVHLDQLPGIGRKLPLNVSLSYNTGENFNPTTGRRNVNGEFMSAPEGSTEEYGALISTKDNRYALRVFRYETGVLNTTSVQIPNANFRLNQFLGPDTVVDIEEGLLRQSYEALVNPPAWSIDDQEKLSAPAWRTFERDFAAAFPGFVSSWLTAGTWAPSNRTTFFTPLFVNTEDSISKGWEVELTANPTRQLRLTVNASKANAERTNVPGASTRAVYEFIQNAMLKPDGTKTAAGLMRAADWQNETMADLWYRQNWVDYGVNQQLNGQPAPELVEWRVNLVANYTFTEGRFKGFGVGGGYRYEDSSTIGFPYYFDQNGTVTLDIARPFRRDPSDRFDVFFRYRHKLFKDKIDWSLRLNIQNVFGDDELIPVRASPDGTIANFRIQQGQSWRLSSTFAF